MAYVERMKATMGEGRIMVVPAAVPERRGPRPGNIVTSTVDHFGLRLESPRSALMRLQAKYAALKAPRENVVDDFIAWRWAEATRE